MTSILKPPPFDPANLFRIRYDYDPLSKIIEYLLKRDKEVTSFMQSMMNNTTVSYDNGEKNQFHEYKTMEEETDTKIDQANTIKYKRNNELKEDKEEEKDEDTDQKASAEVISKENESVKDEKEQFEGLPFETVKRYKVEKVVSNKPINIERELIKSDTIIEMKERIEDLEKMMKELKLLATNKESKRVPVEEKEEIEINESSKEGQKISVIEDKKEEVSLKHDKQREVIVKEFDSSKLEKKINTNTREIGILKELLKDLENEMKKGRSSSKTNVIEASIPQPSKSSVHDDSKSLIELKEKIEQLENQIKDLHNLYKEIDLGKIEREFTYLGKEVSKIKELQESLDKKVNSDQLEKIEIKINSIEGTLDRHIEKHKDDMNNINEEMGKYKQSFELYDSKLAYLTKIVSGLKGKNSAQLESFKANMQKYGPEHFSDAEWNQMKMTVFQLNKVVPEIIEEVEKFRELKRLYNEILVILNDKMDKKEFEAWKNETNIQEILTKFDSYYLERTEYRREFEKLRRRIAGLKTSCVHEEVKETDGDKAMIVKKGLGGWSCASCAKNLTNLAGKKVSYYSWAKLPGNINKLSYSRMLSTLKPEEGFRSQRGEKSAFLNIHESMSDNEIYKEEDNLLPEISGSKCKQNQ